jgi:Nucleotidyltransferase domain
MPIVEAERAYLDEIARRLGAILGEDLAGVYAGGSYSLGAYEAGRSDLDVAAVVRRPLAQEAAAEILAAVGHEALPCPARKLELVVYTEAAARSPSVEPNFELNLDTGPGELRVDLAPQSGEEHWFAIDRSILSSHGVAIVGPPAGEVFASPTREDLLPVLAQGLLWFRDNEPDSMDAVLNAARALRFARNGVWVPKTAVRQWAETAPPDVLDLAIAELESLAETDTPGSDPGVRDRHPPRSSS